MASRPRGLGVRSKTERRGTLPGVARPRRAGFRLEAVALPWRSAFFFAASHALGLERCIMLAELLLEVPQPGVVVTVGRLHDIIFGIELHAHLPKIVAQGAANATAQAGIVPFGTRG